MMLCISGLSVSVVHCLDGPQFNYSPVEGHLCGFCVLLHSQSCLALCNPIACQAPLSMAFPRQEYRSGFSFPSFVDYD